MMHGMDENSMEPCRISVKSAFMNALIHISEHTKRRTPPLIAIAAFGVDPTFACNVNMRWDGVKWDGMSIRVAYITYIHGKVLIPTFGDRFPTLGDSFCYSYKHHGFQPLTVLFSSKNFSSSLPRIISRGKITLKNRFLMSKMASDQYLTVKIDICLIAVFEFERSE